jgi:hypothetical protein
MNSKDLEGSGQGLINILYRHLLGGSEEKIIKDIPVTGRGGP